MELTVVLCSLWWLTYSSYAQQMPQLEVRPIPTNHTVYTVPLGKVHFIGGNWNIFTYINLSCVNREVSDFETTQLKAKNYCISLVSNSTNNYCTLYSTSVNGLAHQIKMYLDNVQFYINPNHQSRRKRGLINGVGRLSNYLFGTLDDKDATKFHKEIDQLKTKQVDMIRISDSQTTVIQSLFNTFNSQTNLTNERFELIQNELINIKKDTLSQIDTNKFLQWTSGMEEINALLLSHATYLINKLTKLITILEQAALGKFHPFLINTKTIELELTRVDSELARSGLKSFVRFIPDKVRWVDLISVDVHTHPEQIIFKLSLPLIREPQGMLYKIWPLPYPEPGDQLFYVIDIKSHYIITDALTEHYFVISGDSINPYCKPVKDSYFCNGELISVTTHPCTTCECLIITNQTSTSEKLCKHKVFPLSNSLWMHDIDQNNWVRVGRNTTTVKVKCSQEQAFDIPLPKRSLLKLKGGCRLIDNGLTIFSLYDPLNSTVEFNNLPPVFFKDFNITNVTNSLHFHDVPRLIKISPSEMSNIGVEISEIKRLEALRDSEVTIPSSTPHHIFLYLILTMIVVGSIIYKVVGKHISQHTCFGKSKEVSVVEESSSKSVDDVAVKSNQKESCTPRHHLTE